MRRKIGLGKCDAEAWLTTMRVAHELGMNTSATMMFGHIEGVADRIHHMELVRRVAGSGIARLRRQRRRPLHGLHRLAVPAREHAARPGARVGSRATATTSSSPFPATSSRASTAAETRTSTRSSAGGCASPAASDYLRTQALSRLYLDNVYSIGASWVTMGPHIGQVALFYGANDMGSVMMEENVVSAAGTTYCLDEPMICRLIRDAGFVPAQRDNAYDLLKIHDGPERPRSPDHRLVDGPGAATACPGARPTGARAADAERGVELGGRT